MISVKLERADDESGDISYTEAIHWLKVNNDSLANQPIVHRRKIHNRHNIQKCITSNSTESTPDYTGNFKNDKDPNLAALEQLGYE